MQVYLPEDPTETRYGNNNHTLWFMGYFKERLDGPYRHSKHSFDTRVKVKQNVRGL